MRIFCLVAVGLVAISGMVCRASLRPGKTEDVLLPAGY